MAERDERTQFLQLPFVGGLDESSAIEYTDPSKRQSTIQNGVFTHNGAIEKRRGMAKLPVNVIAGNAVTASLSSVKRLASSKTSGLLAFTKDALYNSSEEGIAGIGHIPNVRPVRTALPCPPASFVPRLCDFTSAGASLRLAAIQAADFSILITVTDLADGAAVLQPLQIAAALNILMQVFLSPDGTQVVIVYATTAGAAFMRLYDTSALTLGAPIALAVGTAAYLDACPFVNDPASGFIVISVTGATPNNNVDWYYLDLTGAILASGSLAALIPFVPRVYVMATYGVSELIWFTYGHTVGGITNHYEITTLLGDGTFTANATFTVATTAVADSAELAPFCYLDATHAWTALLGLTSGLSGTSILANWGFQYRFDATGGTLQTTAWPMGLYPMGRPVANGTGIDAPVIMPCALLLLRSADNSANDAQTQQPTMYLVQFDERFTDHGLPLATVMPRTLNQGAIGLTLLGTVPVPFTSVGHIGNGSFPPSLACGVNEQSGDHYPIANTQGGAFAADFYFDQSELFQSHELGDGMHVQSGVPFTFDGVSVAEDSFFFYPEFSWLVITHPGTGTLAGTYGAAFIYRSTDANGNETKSAPYFAPITTTLVNGDAIAYHVPRLSMSWRHNAGGPPVYCDIYRTVGNGSTYYLLTTIDVTPKTLPATSADLFAVFAANTTDDASIIKASFLYTTGGVLDNVNPPAFLCQTVHKNRIWGVDETGTRVWFSQAYSPGDSPGYNETLTFDINDGGALTAIAGLDDKLVVFKADSIWIIFGDPPPLTGVGSSLTEPQRIASDVGALDWRSVVLTPKGLMFRASAGIFMLGRDLQVTYIGKPVQDTLGAGTVLSADLVPDLQHVRFLVDTGSSKFVLVYDYFRDQWATFTYDQVLGGANCACVVGGLYALGSPAGFLFREPPASDPFAYLDENHSGSSFFVPTVITTPSIKLQGIQGYQRVRRAQYYGRIGARHALELDIATDNDPATKQSAVWSAIQLSANPYGVQAELHLSGELNKCQSIQVTLTDSIDGDPGSGAGAIFVGLGVEIQTYGKRNRRVPVTARQ